MTLTMVKDASRWMTVVLGGCALVASSVVGQTIPAKAAPAKTENEAKLVDPGPAQSPSPVEGATKPHDDSFVIGNDDVLSINVWKEPDVSKTSIPVRSDGRISLPLAGEIQAAGRTPLALEREIADKLKSYISEPEVTVMVQQINSQKFNILGQVTKPGAYPLTNSATVLDAIALAALLVVIRLEGHAVSSVALERLWGARTRGHRFPDAPERYPNPKDQAFLRFSAEVLPRFGSRCSSKEIF